MSKTGMSDPPAVELHNSSYHYYRCRKQKQAVLPFPLDIWRWQFII